MQVDDDGPSICSLIWIFFVSQQKSLNEESVILSLIAKICLPFLRVASILYHFLYLEPTLPVYQSIANCSSPIEEFTTLATFLNLNHQSSGLENIDSSVPFFHPFINWIENEPKTLIRTWQQEFDKFAKYNPMAARVSFPSINS